MWAAASALTTAGGPILGGWLTENFGWPLVFWINPPLALIAVALLLGFAPEDRREKRPFDMPGAVILATSLGVLAWALSQIGPAEPTGTPAPAALPITIAIVAALVGFAFYAVWESKSDRAMTPPRLWRNRAFVGLNLATVMIYAGLSLMFFLLPFDLIERRGLSATEAGLTLLPFTLGVGFLSSAFGALADKIGARAMLVAGPLAAALAFLWMALTTESSLMLGVLAPMTLLGLAFAVLITPLTATVMSSVEEEDEGLASGVNNTASRIAQLAGIALAAGLASFASGYEIAFLLAAVLSTGGAIAAAATVPSNVKTPIGSAYRRAAGMLSSAPISRTTWQGREESMARSSLSKLLLAGGVLISSVFVAGAGAQSSSPPDLSGGAGGWVHDGGATFPPVKGSPSPVVQDPAHPFISQAASWRIGDLSNPNLKDWVKQVMKKDNDEIHAGKIAFQPRSSCVPSGIPNIFLPGNGLQIVQTRDKIVMFKQGNWEYRHIYLERAALQDRQTVLVRRNRSATGRATRSSSTRSARILKTFVDAFRTPHSENLHVVERWRLIDGGKTLEVKITVDDPGAFNEPWSTYVHHERGRFPMVEDICAENNQNLFDYKMPVEETPDF